MGTVVVTVLAARAAGVTAGHDHIDLEANQLGDDVGKSLEPSLSRATLQDEVLALPHSPGHATSCTNALRGCSWTRAISETGAVVKMTPTR